MTDFKFYPRLHGDRRAFFNMRAKPASHWEELGRKMMIRLFRFTCSNVPAYRAHLAANKIAVSSVNKFGDYRRLPVTDKGTYLRRYNFLDLLPYGTLSRVTTISATSGSTGEPLYFPRGEEHDAIYKCMSELFLANQFGVNNKKTTLGIVGFGLGIWIGGIFTYKNFNRIAAEGYNISLAPIGPNINLYLETVKNIAPYFDQVILMGYPPFIKDVIDQAGKKGIRWGDYNLKILTAAEGYSEKFRDYIIKKASIKNPLLDIVNIYGSVELGTMAHETPLANLIRRMANRDSKVFREIFPRAQRMPTLAQYYPHMIYFEEVNGEVLGSGYGSSIPLLRYRFPDMGGVIPFDTMLRKLNNIGVDIISEAQKFKIQNTILKLPFVYVEGRSDYHAKLRLHDVYPEIIRDALINNKLNKFLTGKFAMLVKNDRKQNQYLEINIETKIGQKITKDAQKTAHRRIIEAMGSKISGPGGHPDFLGETGVVQLVFWPAEHPLYFKSGAKQKWII